MTDTQASSTHPALPEDEEEDIWDDEEYEGDEGDESEEEDDIAPAPLQRQVTAPVAAKRRKMDTSAEKK